MLHKTNKLSNFSLLIPLLTSICKAKEFVCPKKKGHILKMRPSYFIKDK